ncbi:uroporphyrinogen-III C-methyltransferase [Phaeobacter sp. HF9A]|uniref:uroporphyrinogen-III C-methyltransferase n=1 Tax=Phaeobacter sp. HF9A TaxID=2721561 RepID=UPI001431A89C|nr:uroporphyrinogen-III C-methyltransferase [Phaeobacter sp. HF9A]NIZ14515.1 uroporphyrinogen-III C-methyltransferase [Phaeobacter sp. HF9A]
MCAGVVAFAGSGPGDPDLLTLKVLKALQEADVILYDRLVSAEIMALAHANATLEDVGKEGFGPSMAQQEICDRLVAHAQRGLKVLRLKSGDPTIFGRLDEELCACEAAGVDTQILPGITTASAAVAAIGQSLTQRGRNSSVRFLTGHDMKGFADHDWTQLARRGEVAAVYMGKKSARFVQGRLLMHGADPATPVTLVENASRMDQNVLATTLGQLSADLAAAGLTGPALTFIGLAPRLAPATLKMELA